MRRALQLVCTIMCLNAPDLPLKRPCVVFAQDGWIMDAVGLVDMVQASCIVYAHCSLCQHEE